MSRRDFIGGGKGIFIEDVNGSFAKFLKDAPKVANAYLHDAVEKTAFSLANRMRVAVHVGPEAPHIKDHITYKRRGKSAWVGILDGNMPAAPGSETTLVESALYEEYSPNHDPFMRPSAEQEDKDFVRRVTDAMKQTERDLSGGGGLL